MIAAHDRYPDHSDQERSLCEKTQTVFHFFLPFLFLLFLFVIPITKSSSCRQRIHHLRCLFLSGLYINPSTASFPSGVTNRKVNIHFCKRTSVVPNLPIGSFRSTLFHPLRSCTGIGTRAEKFSFFNVISLLFWMWLFSHFGGVISRSFTKMRLSR